MEIPDLYGELTDKDFQEIGNFIYEKYGINLYPRKNLSVDHDVFKAVQYNKKTDQNRKC